MKKQRRASHSAVGDLAKSARRRGILSAGISKSSAKNRRSMGVIGNQVFIPGTPVMTLPELLHEAEEQVGREIEVQKSPGPSSISQVWNARAQAQLEAVGQPDLFKTPMVNRRPKSVALDVDDHGGKRAWAKDDWKQLDACFTDQRLLAGAALEGAGEDILAPVEMIAIDDVVDHFIDLVGGQDVVKGYGDTWSRFVVAFLSIVYHAYNEIPGTTSLSVRVRCSASSVQEKSQRLLHPVPPRRFPSRFRPSLNLNYLL